MAVLIDGYNVLFLLGFVPRQAGPKELEQARRALLDLLADRLGDKASVITVVFDAPRAPLHIARASVYRGIHVRLSSRRQEADDLIEEEIAACRSPQNLTVVSSDNRLIQATQRRGAIPLKAEELLAWLDEQTTLPTSPNTPPPDERPELDATQIQHWLQEFGHLDKDPTLGPPLPFQDEEFFKE